MKKLLYLLIALAIVFGIVSCASGAGVNLNDVPDFYLNPPVAEDAIYGVGSAKMSSLDISRTTAISRARDDIARQVEVTVKNAITDYAQEAGEGDNTQAIRFVETISRQIAQVTLSGVKTQEVSVAKDGTVYALCMYPIASLMNAASAEFQRNEAAAFAEFKADQALQALNFELENNPPSASAGN